MYDEYASYFDDPSEFYRPWGTPNYEIFDKVTNYIKNPMSVERSDIVEIASKVKGMSSETEYIDYLIEHANETFSEKEITKAQELLSKVGFYQGEITGEYNEDFYFAVQAYQKTLNKWDTGVAWQVANKDTWFGKLFGYEGYLDEDGMLNDRLIGIAKRDVELGRNKDGSIYNVLYVGDIIIVSEAAIAVAGEAAIAGAVAYAPRILSYFKKGEKLIEWTGKGYRDIAKNSSPQDLIKGLENSGWTKKVEPGGKKSGPATILTDPNTGTKVRIHAEPGVGNPYFRVQNKGGNYLGDDGKFPSNASKDQIGDLTHFEFGK